jgi:hypothetical protein
MDMLILVFFIQENYLNKINLMKIKNYILLFLILSSISLVISCSKTVIKSPLQFQKELLAGTGAYLNTQRSWQLDSFYIDGINFPLTALQKEYKKIYTYDGLYSDYPDKNSGTWEISTLGKLKQTIIYKTPTIRQDSIIFDIVSINAARMNLSIKSTNGKLSSYSFKIAN